MAYAQSVTVGNSFIERALTSGAEFLTSLAERHARNQMFLQTRDELNALSDRELADLGITRFDIDVIAREATYGVAAR